MSRTTRDIFIRGTTIEKAKDAVVKWFNKNKVKIIINTPEYIFGQWGSGFLTAPKFFEVTFYATENGVTAKTEGWITVYGFAMQDFNATSFFYGGIPRREGMKAIKRLWNTLEALSE